MAGNVIYLAQRRQAKGKHANPPAINKNEAAFCNLLGEVYERQEKLAEAVEGYTQAIAFDPENAQTYVRRGKLHNRLACYEQALADYTRALELEPENDEVRQLREAMEQGRGGHPQVPPKV